MVTHHVEELPPATSQVSLLDEGCAAASGSRDEVLSADLLSQIYRCPMSVRLVQGRRDLEVAPQAWDALLATR